MVYRIEEKKGFRLVGVKETLSTINGYNFKRVPDMWHETIASGRMNKIVSLSNKEPYGILGACANWNKDEFDYYIAASTTKESPEEMSELNVEEGTWAIFEGRGMLNLHPLWQKIYSDWLPTSGYKHTGGADIEWYSDGDVKADDYLYEIWIQVVKK